MPLQNTAQPDILAIDSLCSGGRLPPLKFMDYSVHKLPLTLVIVGSEVHHLMTKVLMMSIFVSSWSNPWGIDLGFPSGTVLKLFCGLVEPAGAYSMWAEHLNAQGHLHTMMRGQSRSSWRVGR